MQTKTDVIIPVLANGRTIESKYNPQRDAENLLNTIEKPFDFFLIFGIGSGIFISKLMEKFPNAFVLGVENTLEDITFLKTFETIQTISKKKNFRFTCINNLQKDLIEYYVPAIYGDLKIIEILPWKNENQQYLSFIKSEIDNAIHTISADFSVQTHFGKLWQNNIVKNLFYRSKDNTKIKIETSKKSAAIIAAGPTLDKKIEYLKSNREKLFIISTDTAYQTLLKNDITPEIVVSIDGQFISHEHFLNQQNKDSIFAFDLCSNNSTLRHINKNQVLFFNSGHPLSTLAADFSKSSFPSLYSGSGTVTITAFDFANFLGFTDIQVIAADFSYQNGKAYSKGTYLDSIYGKNDSKLINQETLFTKLMYRTELKNISKNAKTTEVLESYKNSFELYLKNKNFSFEKKDDIYYTNKDSIYSKSNKSFEFNINFDLHSFFTFLKKEYENSNYLFLLPYISYLRSRQPEFDFDSLVKLAYSELVSYNYFI